MKKSPSPFDGRFTRIVLASLLLLAWPWHMASATTTILLVGDSLSSGYGLSGPGWVDLANEELAEQGHDIEIINDSISGDTTAGGLARIRDGIARTEPHYVLIELGGNDGLRGVRPSVIENNLTAMVEAANDSGAESMLLGMRIPPNYGKAYTERFADVYERVSENLGVPLLPFFIGELALDPAFMQSDMIHPNDAAQPLISDRVVPFILSALDRKSM